MVSWDRVTKFVHISQALYIDEASLHSHYVECHPDLVGSISESDQASTWSCIHCDQVFDKPVMLLRHVRFAHLLGKSMSQLKTLNVCYVPQ